jgi:hypothetical protein
MRNQFSQMLFSGDEPRRPLDWRFRRAGDLSKVALRKRNYRESDDDLVRRYSETLYQLGQYDSYAALEKVKKKDPDIFAVHLSYYTMNATELAILDAFLLGNNVDPNYVRQHTGLTRVQQELYKAVFLDIEDRRDMSLFIATQLMESDNLRGVSDNASLQGSFDSDFDELEGPDLGKKTNRSSGSFNERARRVLRVVGFYSSPIVVELLYSGFLQEEAPIGRDSAIRFMNQGYFMNLRRRGLMASYIDCYNDNGLDRFIKLAYDLAKSEKEEGQADILQNIEALVKGFGHRIGVPGAVIQEEMKTNKDLFAKVEAAVPLIVDV